MTRRAGFARGRARRQEAPPAGASRVITIDEDVYERLKGELPPKGISRFISEAVSARLRPGRDELDRACQAAAKERWRKAESDDWSAVDTEDWPA